MERALYNGVISGVSLDGKKFFYGNPLSSYPGLNGNGRYVNKSFHYDRSEWFDCACCPPNLARMIAQFPLYVYSTKRNEVYIHLYARNTAVLEVAGQTVEIVQKTDYPWKEKVAITVNPKNTGTWTLALRIPGWCNGAKLKINGKPFLIPPLVQKGYARIRRTWNRGDKIELILPMPPVRIEAHPKARQDCGRIALQRGPLVYCLEEVDNGKYLNDIALPRDSRLLVKNEPTTTGTVPFVLAKARRRDTGNWQHTLYRPAVNRMKSTTLKAIPYFMWANRKPGEMLVWIRES